MKTKFRIALVGAAAFVAQSFSAQAHELLAMAREEARDSEAVKEVATEKTDHAAEPTEPSVSSRGTPAPAPARTTTRPATPVTSRGDTGTMVRTVVTEVIPDSSHIVIKTDDALQHFRYTRETHFMDETGRVTSADAVKSGTTATLHFAKTDGDIVLTKVIVNSGHHATVSSPVSLEIPFER